MLLNYVASLCVMSSSMCSFPGMLLVPGAHLCAENILSAHRHITTLLNVIAGIAIYYSFLDMFPRLARKHSTIEGMKRPAR